MFLKKKKNIIYLLSWLTQHNLFNLFNTQSKKNKAKREFIYLFWVKGLGILEFQY